MATAQAVSEILRADEARWQLLGIVAALSLPDCWIGAGLIRNAVWDHLHHRPTSPITGDVDVIWFDAASPDPATDTQLEAHLRQIQPTIKWSVKNQARMHIRNGDKPYSSATDAMRFWPETATAVAARKIGSDKCEIAAPLGLGDLFALRIRPTHRFATEKRSVFENRLRAKDWTTNWPLLRKVES